jgi:hypothetical protein
MDSIWRKSNAFQFRVLSCVIGVGLGLASICYPAVSQDLKARKLSPSLRTLADKGGDEQVPVAILLSRETNLKGLVESPKITDMGGVKMVRGLVAAKGLKHLSALPEVDAILDAGPRPAPKPPDSDLHKARPKAISEEEFQTALKTAPPYRAELMKVTQDARHSVSKSWWGNDEIGVPEARARGIDGGGVKVAVIDTGVDFANPDLLGTQARVDNPASPHFGWPICFDGFSMATYFLKGTSENTWYVNTVAPHADVHGATATAFYHDLLNGGIENREFTFFAESVSGVYYFGIHPDTSLPDVLDHRTPAFIVVDHPDVANRGPGYNTVYVDLNGDGKFTDEKACYRGDEVSYRDVWNSEAGMAGTDGYPDISGGMVYFIADGVRPIPASEWLYNAPIPQNGHLVAFMLNDIKRSGEDHGTLCASAVAAQGVINGAAPATKPPFSGSGDGMVQGPAKGARIVALGDFYEGGFFTDYYLFCALGYDGIANTGDEPNVVSMSFGYTFDDANGWDFEARFIDYLNRQVAPRTTWMHSSANNAPGYATVGNPSPPSGINVGACTSYDTCDVFDSIQSATQIVSGDIQSWSSSGPLGTGAQGVNVVAHGAWGSGDLPLNMAKDGWTAWDSWGGTSRACPEAAAVAAMIYQSYHDQHGIWPDFRTTREILMNSATNLDYDVFRQGAGRVHAGRAAALAGEADGVRIQPPLWVAGDYRGQEYPGYASIIYRGDSIQKTFQIANTSSSAVTLDVHDSKLEEFGHTDFVINTVASPLETYDFRRPNYLHLFQGNGVNSIPPETTLMVVEAVFPFETLDTDYSPGDVASISPPAENLYRLLLYDWSDINGDGKLYDDSLGLVPGVVESNEIESGEYMRFNYSYVGGNTELVFLSDPLAKMHDGIWIGLQHRRGPIGGTATPVRIRARFFHEVDCPWLQTNTASLQIPANATGTLTATVQVPADQPFGAYSAKIQARQSAKGNEKGVGDETVIPVSINVAADLMAGGVAIGGATEGSEPLDNFALHGNWGWDERPATSDRRVFLLDAVNPPPGSYLVARTTWEDSAPSDIDTIILGPAEDPFSTPGSPFYRPTFGPNTLATIGGVHSPNEGDWLYQTSSGTSLDYAVAPLVDGLHAFMVNNVLHSGRRSSIPFSIEAGTLVMEPDPLQIFTTDSQVVSSVTVTSSMAIPDAVVSAYGPSPINYWYQNQGIMENDSYWWSLNIANCALLRAELSGTADDLDLYIYRDGANGNIADGNFSDSELIKASYNRGSDEFLDIPFPPDGYYRVSVYGYRVLNPTDTFSLTGHIIENQSVQVTPGAPGGIAANVPKTYGLSTTLGNLGEYEMLFVMGPSSAPHSILLRIPITYFDLKGFSRFWQSQSGIPAGIDINHNGKLNAEDLIGFLKARKTVR